MREGHKGEKEVGARCLLCDEKRVVGHSREQKKKKKTNYKVKRCSPFIKVSITTYPRQHGAADVYKNGLILKMKKKTI